MGREQSRYGAGGLFVLRVCTGAEYGLQICIWYLYAGKVGMSTADADSQLQLDV